MKKSTLITTIAMIVVVVVALSTATYAWFTSAQTTTATATMQTTSTTDFSLTVVRATTGTATWSEGETGTGIGLTGSTILSAPTDTIATAVSYNLSSAAVSNPALFYEAKVNAGTTKIESDATAKGIDAIRLTNVRAEAKNVYLYVVVDVSAENANTLYAAQATSFYVNVAADAESTANTGIWTNGYGKASDTKGSAEDVVAYGTDVKVGTFNEANASANGTYNTKTARPAYNGLATDFATAAADKAEIGVTKDHYVLIYLIDLGSIQPSESIILGIYTWIDGWKADTAAGGAAYNVTYAFTSTLQTFNTVTA